MSSNENRLPYRIAAEAAKQICTAMLPHCHRVAVAGSLRRRKDTVGDIEIVAIPKWATEIDPTDLFAETSIDINLLYRDWASSTNLVKWIKPGAVMTEWAVKPEGRYWRGLLNDFASSEGSECKVDIFLTTTERWGVRYLLSTGSAEFNAEIVTHARRVGYVFDEGCLWQVGWKAEGERVLIKTPDEATVFHELGLEFVPPHLRQGKDDVRAVKTSGQEATDAR